MTNLYLPSLQLARHSNCVSATGYDDDYDDHGRLDQGCRSCSILPSRMGEHEVSLENMGNMENMENMEKMENINQMTQKSPEDF